MSNPFDQFDAPTPKRGAKTEAAPAGANPFDQFDQPAPGASKGGGGPSTTPSTQTAAGGPSQAQQPYSWGQMGKDALRDYLDTLTFGLGDKALGLYTGQDEAANTEAAKSRLGLLALAPEALGYMTNPLGDLGIGAKVAGKALPYVGRWAAGALGSAASGAAITGAQDIGHGQMPTAGDLLLGAGVGGAAGALGGVGRSAVKPAIASSDALAAQASQAGQAAAQITQDGKGVVQALNNPIGNFSARDSTVYNGSGVKRKVQGIQDQIVGRSLIGQDPTMDDINGWKRDIMGAASGGNERRVAQQFNDALDSHVANNAPTSGHSIADAQAADQAIQAAGAQKGFAQTLEDMAQKPETAPGKAADELYKNEQFYKDQNTGQLNNYGQALQGVASTAGHAPSTWLIRRVGLPIAEHAGGALLGGIAGYESGGKESPVESAILGSMLGGVAPAVAHAYMEKGIAARQARALQAARATATAGAPTVGGPLVSPEAFLPQAWKRNLLQQGALGALAGNAPGSQPNQP